VDVAVLGRKQTVPDEVRALAEAKVAKLGRLNPVLERAEVRLTEDRDAPGAGKAARKVCEVTITGHGHTLRAKAAAHDQLVAVDKVVDKLEHQVERLKGKLVGRSHPRRPPNAVEGPPDTP
jgi:ribosomal subunit interface protein